MEGAGGMGRTGRSSPSTNDAEMQRCVKSKLAASSAPVDGTTSSE